MSYSLPDTVIVRADAAVNCAYIYGFSLTCS